MKKYIIQNNHSQRKSGPALSEIFSSDVSHSVWDSPTDTPPALNETFTKVENISQSAKNNIQKFVNNDIRVDFNGTR